MGPIRGSWLAARMADLTSDLQVILSWGSIAEGFHYLQSLSISCFPVIFSLPGPPFPSTCRLKAVLTAPLERSTCPYQRSLLSFRMRSQILNAMPRKWLWYWTWWWQCLAAWHCRSVWPLPWHFAIDVGGLALSMAKSHWHGALRSAQKNCTHNIQFHDKIRKNPLIFVFLSYLKDFVGTEKNSNHPG